MPYRPPLVRLRRASAPHPPLKRETPHIWGVSHVHGGQRPISLEYQINHPPQVHSTSDTLVTGMVCFSPHREGTVSLSQPFLLEIERLKLHLHFHMTRE